MLFQTASGGTINLNALTSIDPDSNGNIYGYSQTRFNMGATTYALPSLTNAQETEFDIPSGGTINVPLLQSFSSLSVLNLPSGATFNAPNLTQPSSTPTSRLPAGHRFSTGACRRSTARSSR